MASTLIYSLDLVEDEDIESWYDGQDQLDGAIAFRLEYIDSNCSSELDSSDFEEHFPVMQVEEISKALNLEIGSLDPIPPLPNTEVVHPSKYDVTIKAIAFMDTGAQNTLMIPAILPSSAWESSVHFFKAINGKTFWIDLIIKHKIGIKFFPECII